MYKAPGEGFVATLTVTGGSICADNAVTKKVTIVVIIKWRFLIALIIQFSAKRDKQHLKEKPHS
jgi:hypothetical protein